MRWIDRLNLGQQLGLLAALCCFLATVSALLITFRSMAFVDDTTRQAMAQTVIDPLTRRVAALIAADDTLGATHEIRKLADDPLIQAIDVTDIDGNSILRAGKQLPNATIFSSNMMIGEDFAGSVKLQLATSTIDQQRQNLRLSIIGFGLLAASITYLLMTQLSANWVSRIRNMSRRLSPDTDSDAGSELAELEEVVATLPIELLAAPAPMEFADDAIQPMAAVTLALRHLPRYADTLDPPRLTAYIGVIERVVRAVAKLNSGTVHVTRAHSMTLLFESSDTAPGAFTRACDSAVLIQQLLLVAEQSQRLKLSGGLAIGINEMGYGDEHASYLRLYAQALLDELHELAVAAGDSILLTPVAADEADLANSFPSAAINEAKRELGAPSAEHADTIQTQLKMLQRALFPDVGEQSALPF